MFKFAPFGRRTSLWVGRRMSANLYFVDPNGDALRDIELLADAPDLEKFPIAETQLSYPSGHVAVTAQITSITLVPEPTASQRSAAAILCLILLRRSHLTPRYT